MRRTNLVLDEALLKEATQVLGEKTYSAAVNRALADALRAHKIQNLSNFFGQGLWEGDLTAMRQDRPRQPRKKSARIKVFRDPER
jgi:Arc/MetJ family transcription regulator